MEEMQAELDQITVEGTAGGGMVSVTLTAKGDMKGVRIDPSLIMPRVNWRKTRNEKPVQGAPRVAVAANGKNGGNVNGHTLAPATVSGGKGRGRAK